MNTEEVLNVMDAHLQEVNADQKERLSRINEMLDYLNYNKRLTELSEAEKQAFVDTMEGSTLSEYDRKKLDGLKSEKERDHYINEVARTVYFRRCAWLSYLSGERADKPYVESASAQTDA
jgi:hypothetical protein